MESWIGPFQLSPMLSTFWLALQASNSLFPSSAKSVFICQPYLRLQENALICCFIGRNSSGLTVSFRVKHLIWVRRLDFFSNGEKKSTSTGQYTPSWACCLQQIRLIVLWRCLFLLFRRILVDQFSFVYPLKVSEMDVIHGDVTDCHFGSTSIKRKVFKLTVWETVEGSVMLKFWL